MKRIMCLIAMTIWVGCGGSGSPTGPGGTTTQPTKPTVQDRTFVLSKLAIDSGQSPLEIVSPQAMGRLEMRANGAYTMMFGIDVENFEWSQNVMGTHTFSEWTLKMTPAASSKTSVEPFVQTVIVDTLSVGWNSDTQVVIPLPIRPGAWRDEDTLLLTYTLSQTAGKPVVVPRDDTFDYDALVTALQEK